MDFALDRPALRRRLWWLNGAAWLIGMCWLGVSLPAATRVGDFGTRMRAELFHGIASHLVRLERHVYWPPGTRTIGTPLRIGLLGQDRIGDTLEKVLAAKGGVASETEVKRAERVEELLDCDLVFMDQPTRSAAQEAARALAGKPVLLVAFEAEEKSGVAVNFVLTKGLGLVLRYRLDVEAMRRGGLTPSDGLLNMALPPAERLGENGGGKP